MLDRAVSIYKETPDGFWQFFRFVFVGVLNTIVGYGSYLILLYAQAHYLIAMAGAHMIGVIHSYFWNKYWTFKSKSKSYAEKVKFVSVYTVTFVLNGLLLILFVEVWNISEELSGLFALFVVTIVSYIGHKFWSFKVKIT